MSTHNFGGRSQSSTGNETCVEHVPPIRIAQMSKSLPTTCSVSSILFNDLFSGFVIMWLFWPNWLWILSVSLDLQTSVQSTYSIEHFVTVATLCYAKGKNGSWNNGIMYAVG